MTVALVTGGARGIGAALVRRLAARGASVVVADLDLDAARAVADAVSGAAVRCDVSSAEDNAAAVAAAVELFGGLDLAVLNAGVTGGVSVGDDFDLARYRRLIGANLDGPVFGLHAAHRELRARGGGDVVVTASMAALAPVPQDPLYAASKAAVAALVRSVAPVWAADGIRVNALCPSYTDTDLVAGHHAEIAAQGLPLLTVEDVADAFERVLDAGQSGEAWMVVPGREPAPFRFGGVPGPRG
jgi:NAD(P)-dependent dehydrogenase (short-subunit alcohol dehydrogenase family)